MALLTEYNSNDSLLKHAYAVEGVMRYLAQKLGEDADKWAIVGLVHDLDYEQFPERHCSKTKDILEEHQWPQEYIRAVVSHGWGIYNDIEPQSLMEKYLYTIDELTGLVAAAALVRPSKSVMDLESKSVAKKWKDKSFAAGVDRSVIDKGIQMLGIERNQIITDTIMGMRQVSDKIGL